MSSAVEADASQHSLSLHALLSRSTNGVISSLTVDQLGSAEVSSYLRSLSHLPLAELRQQPQQLQVKAESLRRQLAQLCISQTDAFVSIYDAEQLFSPSLSALHESLSSLIHNSLPALQNTVDTFPKASQPALYGRRKLQNVADKYEKGKLADLLDIPRLVETCVKAGHHAEAIQLTGHLVTLLHKSKSSEPHSNPSHQTHTDSDEGHGQHRVLLSLLSETVKHLAKMKLDLLATFTKPGLELPAADKAVAFLRSMDRLSSSMYNLPELRMHPSHLGLTDSQLCLSFLKARFRSFDLTMEGMGSPS